MSTICMISLLWLRCSRVVDLYLISGMEVSSNPIQNSQSDRAGQEVVHWTSQTRADLRANNLLKPKRHSIPFLPPGLPIKKASVLIPFSVKRRPSSLQFWRAFSWMGLARLQRGRPRVAIPSALTHRNLGCCSCQG